MVIELPDGTTPPTRLRDELTPRRIVQELDRHVVAQGAAKRAVAVALRNRLRRRMLPPDLAEEVAPKNILMIGPTGVGKTEIARRLARLARSPFLKVEASRFTEVGYMGRDVESMIRELMEIGVEMVREEEAARVREKAARVVEERLLDLLLTTQGATEPVARDTLRRDLEAGRLEDRPVRIEVQAASFPPVGILAGQGMEELEMNLRDMLGGMMPGKRKEKTLPVREAREALRREEEQRLVDMDQVSELALERVQGSGIIFLDEMDKVAGRESGRGPDVSREGVQRDLLPIVEGTTVQTKHGMVRTDHVLFIAAGAFHVSKPSDLIPELQGRFPIRVELQSLGREEFVRILTEPEHSLVRQYTELLATEGVELEFTGDGIETIADLAARVNESAENIGARRLHTVLEKVLETVSFEAPELEGTRQVVNEAWVRQALEELVGDEDLSRYIL